MKKKIEFVLLLALTAFVMSAFFYRAIKRALMKKKKKTQIDHKF